MLTRGIQVKNAKVLHFPIVKKSILINLTKRWPIWITTLKVQLPHAVYVVMLFSEPAEPINGWFE